jgi:hypothetical protein
MVERFRGSGGGTTARAAAEREQTPRLSLRTNELSPGDGLRTLFVSSQAVAGLLPTLCSFARKDSASERCPAWRGWLLAD